MKSLCIIGHSQVSRLRRSAVRSFTSGDDVVQIEFHVFPGKNYEYFHQNLNTIINQFQRIPSYLMIVLGSNDCDSNVPLAQIRIHMGQFYRELQSLLPNTIIIPCQIEPRPIVTTSNNYQHRANKLNTWLRTKCVKDHLMVVRGNSGVDCLLHYARDGVHWNNTGAIWVNILIRRCIRHIDGIWRHTATRGTLN